MFPFNYNISSVQPTVAASEGSSNFGHQRGDREESHAYLGVQKVTDKQVYLGQVHGNDATNSEQLIYLGKFDKAINAARAHDLVALRLWGSSAKTNFPESEYKGALEAMTDMTQTEVVETVRKLSFTFTKSMSMYRGVTRDLSTGRWEASFETDSNYRSFLGLFDKEEEAARAYDFESIRLNGYNAVTNFSIQFYDVEGIKRGQTDIQSVIYRSNETVNTVGAMQQCQVFDNIITQDISTMFHGTSQYLEFGTPVSGNSTTMIPNVTALASSQFEGPSLNHSIDQENVTALASSQFEGPPLNHSSDQENGQRRSTPCFQREKTNPYAKFIKKNF